MEFWCRFEEHLIQVESPRGEQGIQFAKLATAIRKGLLHRCIEQTCTHRDDVVILAQQLGTCQHQVLMKTVVVELLTDK